ncbi:MAG TPA: quinone oxidoreductase [Jatrophihabitans sp.]|jgi:NADPH2:quinone reductase|uniref:quinone oxidoreductase family protein n=1 Tax=Jatrophihabitans sp. TaxID=1932789 RepID=UPI002DFE4E77|nr:quinone oxidoreductase [Jatrophihabitans sp.]
MAEDMRAVIVTEHGNVDVLEVQDRPMPHVGAGELLVRVAASGVNFIDVYQREGIYPGTTPFGLGMECAGEVLAVGDGVDGVSVGDVVATAEGHGTHATVSVVEAAKAVPVPDGVASDVAAAAMLQGMTAHYLVHSTYPVREGDDVLVHAAAGGVGQLLVQMVKAQGARVIATVGSAAKVAVASAAGADHVIRYDEVDELAAAVREIVPDGVHVAYDGVGKATFDASMGSLRRRGTLALFGAASGPVPPVDPQRLNRGGSLFLTRPTLAHYTATREELLERAGDVLTAVLEGTLSIAIGGRYRLDDVARAYRDLEGRATTGKLLLEP